MREGCQEDHEEPPRKSARLNGGHDSQQEEPQQPSEHIADSAKPERKQKFTVGPSHLVFIDDRVKNCPAICFNEGLFNAFNEIAVSRREVQQRDKAVRKAQFEFEQIKSSNMSAGIEQAKKLVEEASKNQEIMEAGIAGLIEARRIYEDLAQENKRAKSNLDTSREMIQLVIEQMLDRENLLNIPSSKPQEQANDTKKASWESAPVPETEKTVDDAQISNKAQSAPPSSPSTRQSPTNNEMQMHITPRQLALREVRFAAQELRFRQDELTFMQEEYAQAIAAERRYRREQHPNSPASTTQTDLDLQGLQKAQYATRMLIDAEEDYDRAERYAEDLGLGDILADPHACYYGEVYNDFPAGIGSPRPPAVVPVNRPKIEAWMAAIPDFAERVYEDAETVEVDDWDAKSLEIYESASLVATDMYRKKIDGWQEQSGRLREDKAHVALLGKVL